MATRLSAELIVRRIRYIRSTKEAAIQVASHELPRGQFCKKNKDVWTVKEVKMCLTPSMYLC